MSLLPRYENHKLLSAEQAAIASSCCGVTGEITLTDSAIIILFASALGAGDMLSLITTSALPLFNGLLIIPAAYFITRIGRLKLIGWSCTLAAAAYLMAASAPFFGDAAMPVLIGMILLFALSLPGFIAGWFPLLDTFLPATHRTAFLGRMRFLHQLTAIAFLFVVSLVIGSTPPVPVLQGVLYAGAVIFIGRIVFIARIPHFPDAHREVQWKHGLAAAARNRALTVFSIYQFILNLLIYGTIPVAMLYLKKSLEVPDNVIVFISGAALGGMLLGYLAAGHLRKHFSLRTLFLAMHLIPIPVNMVLFLTRQPDIAGLTVLTAMLMIAGFVVAVSSILCSAEMMALAKPGNKTMAMAWSGAFFYCGYGFSRLLASFFLGNSTLSATRLFGDFAVTGYQMLFFSYAILLLPALFVLFRIPAVCVANEPIPDQQPLQL